MIAENVFFGIIAAAMAISALGVVTTKNVVHAALFLVIVLAGGAAQFILLGQEFVAWVQVLVYIGAVIVLFLFGIMLTQAPMHPTDTMDNNLRFWALLPSGLLAVAFSAIRSARSTWWMLIDSGSSECCLRPAHFFFPQRPQMPATS